MFLQKEQIGTEKNEYNSFVTLNLIFKNKLIVKITGNGPCVHPHFHGLKYLAHKKHLLMIIIAQNIFSKIKFRTSV